MNVGGRACPFVGAKRASGHYYLPRYFQVVYNFMEISDITPEVNIHSRGIRIPTNLSAPRYWSLLRH